MAVDCHLKEYDAAAGRTSIKADSIGSVRSYIDGQNGYEIDEKMPLQSGSKESGRTDRTDPHRTEPI